MTAKEAIQQELGDLFKDVPSSAVVQDEISDDSDVQGDEESVVEEGDGFYDGVFAFEEQDDDSTQSERVDDGEEEISDADFQDLLDRVEVPADYAGDQPLEENEDGRGVEQPQLSAEEISACIDAANETMDTVKMSPEALDWGLDYLKKMYQQQNDQLRARLAQSDRNAARARYKAMADEEEAQERAEKEQFLRG